MPYKSGKSFWGKQGDNHEYGKGVVKGKSKAKGKSHFYGQCYHSGDWVRSQSWCPNRGIPSDGPQTGNGCGKTARQSGGGGAREAMSREPLE